MQTFNEKTVVITGGGGGIGGATSRRFARQGARVAVFDLNPEAAEKVAAQIRAEGGQAQAFRCDITDRASVDAAVAATLERFGAIDVLVNNAGWDVFKPFTKAIPLGRLGQPQDLAAAIAFFASDDAGFITGQVLSVSGGLTMNG